MFVYVWKTKDGVPRYVGMTKNIGRTNPMTAGGRGPLCKHMLQSIGRANLVVELHTLPDIAAAVAMERTLILQHGRISHGTGPLTNLTAGGDGHHGVTPEGRERIAAAVRARDPATKAAIAAKVHTPARRAAASARMQGANNFAKTPAVRAKIKAKWAEPGYKEAMHARRLGKLQHTQEFKEAARARLMQPDNPLRTAHVHLNTDPAIRAKRAAKARTPEAREVVRQRNIKRWSDPAAREAVAEKMRLHWANKKKAT